MIVEKKARKRNETRDLTQPIRAALNKLPGVRVARNNTGLLQWGGATSGNGLRYGLGIGSADLVGLVQVSALLSGWQSWAPDRELVRINGSAFTRYRVGRAFCLEVKWPGRVPSEDQIVWLRVVRSLGGFAAVVSSVEEALAAVDRCRRGESE